MIAIDTNVLVRWAMRDDDAQLPMAMDVLSGPCWLEWTVLLEFAWVLRSYSDLNRREIADILDTVLLLPEISYAHPEAVRWAIERFRAGADIADMVHLAACPVDVEGFATFDRSLKRKAGANSPVPVKTLLSQARS